MDELTAFMEAISDAGITPPGEIVPDGEIHRFSTNGKNGDKSGWYLCYPDDPMSGAFGCWRTGAAGTWCCKSESEMTPADKEAFRHRVEKAKAQRDADRQRETKKARETAKQELDRAEPADAHPYLSAKQIKPHGLKQDAQGRLLIPVKGITGELHSLQRIDAEGVKRFLPGGAISGNFAAIGQRGDAGPVFVVEGWATGASIRAATGAAVVVAFNAGNLEPVVRAIREKSPDREIVICGDDDRFKEKNAGRIAATEAAKRHGCKAIFPQFKTLDGKPTDFNDLATREGLEAVKRQVGGVGIIDRLTVITAGTLTQRPAPPEFIIECNGRGLVRKKIVGGIAATGGTGKTFFFLQLGLCMAGGPSFHPFSPVGEPRVLYIGWEEDAEELSRRIWDITGGHIPERFNAVSALGIIPAMFKMDAGKNAVRADGDAALMTVFRHIRADVVLLDPFSSFYGLEEKNDVHGNAYINRMREIGLETGGTFLVSHHTNEASEDNKGRMSKRMFRGVSAFTDGYRFAAGMRKMPEATAKRYGIQQNRRYVEFDTPKANGGAELASSLYFHQQEETGVLEHFDPEGHRGVEIADALVDILETEATSGKFYSRNEIIKGKAAKNIRDELSETFDNFKACFDIPAALDTAWRRGLIRTEYLKTGKTTKPAITPATVENPAITLETGTPKNAGKKTVSTVKGNDNSMIAVESDNAGKQKLSTVKSNDFNKIAVEKIHPLKGGGGYFPPSTPPGDFGADTDTDTDPMAAAEKPTDGRKRGSI